MPSGRAVLVGYVCASKAIWCPHDWKRENKDRFNNSCGRRKFRKFFIGTNLCSCASVQVIGERVKRMTSLVIGVFLAPDEILRFR